MMNIKPFNKLKDSKGQAMVEMAIILPLLLTVLFGIIDLGLLYSNRIKFESATVEASRYISRHTEEDPALLENKAKEIIRSSMGIHDGDSIYISNITIDSDLVQLSARYTFKPITYVGYAFFSGNDSEVASNLVALHSTFTSSVPVSQEAGQFNE